MKNNVLEGYSFLLSALSMVVFPVIYLSRVLQKKDVTSWKTKFGNYELPENFDKSKKTIMVHGVSVGEVVSLEKLIRKIKNDFPEYNLILTTGTKTGQETAIKKMSDCTDFITYFPFEVKTAVNKFLDIVSPDVVLMAETEIWPNFVYNCKLRNIPVMIINGRMSDESFKSYLAMKPFFKEILPLYNGIYVQSEIDKERLKAVGAPVDKLEVMKNLKFDVKKFDVDLDLKKGSNKAFIAGSTHKGEDEIVLSAFRKLKEKDENLKLLLAPRHLTRTEQVENLIKKRGFKYNLYSKNPSFENADIILLDVMGELAKLYSVIDVAFIGGSFNKTGGHNPLEAIIFNKPVISGPSIKNFRDIYAILCSTEAGRIAHNEKEFLNSLDKLLFDEEFYKKASKDCLEIFNNQQGALDFVCGKLTTVLKG